MTQHKISDLEYCWLLGFKSYHGNIDETANPYETGSKYAHYWREGWWEAFFNVDNLSDMYQQHYSQLSVDRLAS